MGCIADRAPSAASGSTQMPNLTGKRILVTQSNDFTGPALRQELAAYGAFSMGH